MINSNGEEVVAGKSGTPGRSRWVVKTTRTAFSKIVKIWKKSNIEVATRIILGETNTSKSEDDKVTPLATLCFLPHC